MGGVVTNRERGVPSNSDFRTKGRTYVIKVMIATKNTIMTFFLRGQFIGFCGSSGPSQSTILGSWKLSVSEDEGMGSLLLLLFVLSCLGLFPGALSISRVLASAMIFSVEEGRDRLSPLVDCDWLFLPTDSTTVEASKFACLSVFHPSGYVEVWCVEK